MKQLTGKTVFISGGAEGIGFGIAKALGLRGMNVVLTDIDREKLEAAEKSLAALDIPVLAMGLDVADFPAWQSVAREAVDRFGKLHMLVNNAGVGGNPAIIEETQEQDWQWVIDINLMGVVNGARALIPLIKQHGEGGWLISVASMAGFGGVPMASPYAATKAAVVAMSECWHAELEPHDIKVSVLCPGFVKTRINQSTRNKQQRYTSVHSENSDLAEALSHQMQSVIDAGMAPELVGERLIEALNAGELYIFTHPNYRSLVNARFTVIDEAFARAESSPLLTDFINEEIPSLG
jgi:NAD(P)-dependent dehydrogenase (short-subunit alcohol dehydrogenase family)